MPRILSNPQREFLTWIESKGGKCTWKEMIVWVKSGTDRGVVNQKGQGIENKYLRLFCDKSGTRGSRKEWFVRPEALQLINL